MPFEIVVIDNDPDGSARQTVETKAQGSGVPIRYVHEPRPGISHARNTGIANASGRYVVFIDDDEEAAPGWLAAFLATAKTCGADVVIGPVLPRFPPGGPTPDAYRRRVYTRNAQVPTGTVLSRWSGIGNTLLDKERCVAGIAEPFDPRLGLSGGEDSLFLRQLMRRGCKLVWCAEAVAWEEVPVDRLGTHYLLRRAFRGAQTTTFVCTAITPPEWGRAMLWMAIGCAQVVLYAPVALLLWSFKDKRWLRIADKAVGGLGKVLWHPKMHLRLYR